MTKKLILVSSEEQLDTMTGAVELSNIRNIDEVLNIMSNELIRLYGFGNIELEPISKKEYQEFTT